jgi:hypothetical protein
VQAEEILQELSSPWQEVPREALTRLSATLPAEEWSSCQERARRLSWEELVL